MKANHILFSALAVTLVSAYTMSPSDFLAHSKTMRGRFPASEKTPTKPAAKKPVAKKPVTSKEMLELKAKLAKLEADLKDKEVQLDQKAKEVEVLRNNKTEEKIEALTKLIAEQKADIEKLRSDIKNSEVKNINVLNQTQNQTSVEVVVCKSESKGEKLEAELKKLLEDKELVLKQVDGLKKENEDLKGKISSVEAKPVKVDNTDLVALMSQMTSMFTAQMQSQMQLQTQMMNILSQMQFNSAPQYTWDLSQAYNRPFAIQENFGMGLGGYGVGIPAYASYPNFGGNINPYSQLPQMSRQPAQQSDFGFSFGQIPQANHMQGFDFNLSPAQPAQPALPEIKRQQLPSQTSILSA